MAQHKTEVTAECPNCEELVRLGSKPRIGQRVVCPYCGEPLRVINLDPPELDWDFEEPAPESGENWG